MHDDFKSSALNATACLDAIIYVALMSVITRGPGFYGLLDCFCTDWMSVRSRERVRVSSP